MRYAWTDEGDDPSWEKGDEYDVDGYFFPMEDPVTTTALVQQAEHRGHAYGLYLAQSWHSGYSPAQLAQVALDEYRRITKSSTVLKKLRVMFNIEIHDPDYIAATLELFRAKLPNVGLSFSPEGMQGGWMGPVLIPGQAPAAGGFVARLLAMRTRIVPQGYWGANGTIEGDWAHDQVLRDLTKRGFPESVVSIFHDAKTLGEKRGAEGFVFTIGRLPA